MPSKSAGKGRSRRRTRRFQSESVQLGDRSGGQFGGQFGDRSGGRAGGRDKMEYMMIDGVRLNVPTALLQMRMSQHHDLDAIGEEVKWQWEMQWLADRRRYRAEPLVDAHDSFRKAMQECKRRILSARGKW